MVAINVANPSFNEPLSPILDSFLPSINRNASESIKQLFNDSRLKRQIEYQINQQIREIFVRNGRIVEVTIYPDAIIFDVEAGA